MDGGLNAIVDPYNLGRIYTEPKPGTHCLSCEKTLQQIWKTPDLPFTASSLFCADCSAALRSDDKMYLIGWHKIVSPFSANDAYIMGKEDREGEQE